MFAVVKTGGKQYKVAPNDVIKVEKLAGEAGSSVDLADVLMLGEGDDLKVGAPTVEGAVVRAEVLEQTKGDKVVVFKKKRRQGYRRTRGHRQELTVLRVTDILADGSKKAAPKKAAAKKAAPKAKAEDAAPAAEAETKE
ncbi:MAG: 50S ribosomal protein L21 [Nisaea sp.]|jgi:large subunit ribosomal protein L21|nr:50S ribosomal protein L21 [Nisaea sp.]